MYSDKLIEDVSYCFGYLLTKGKLAFDQCRGYSGNEIPYKELLSKLAAGAEARIIYDDENLYIVPVSYHSPLHMRRSEVKNRYFTSKFSTKASPYIAELMILILVKMMSEINAQFELDVFVPKEDWLSQVNDFFKYLHGHRDEYASFEAKDQINWTDLLDRWEAMNNTIDQSDISKETAKSETKWSYLNQSMRLLEDSGFAKSNEDEQVFLTDKGRNTLKMYLEDSELHRNILRRIHLTEEAAEGGKL